MRSMVEGAEVVEAHHLLSRSRMFSARRLADFRRQADDACEERTSGGIAGVAKTFAALAATALLEAPSPGRAA